MVLFDSKPEKGELNKVIDHLKSYRPGQSGQSLRLVNQEESFFFYEHNCKALRFTNMHGHIWSPKTISHYLTKNASSKIYPKRALISHYLIVMLHPKYTQQGCPLFHFI